MKKVKKKERMKCTDNINKQHEKGPILLFVRIARRQEANGCLLTCFQITFAFSFPSYLFVIFTFCSVIILFIFYTWFKLKFIALNLKLNTPEITNLSDGSAVFVLKWAEKTREIQPLKVSPVSSLWIWKQVLLII